MNNLMTVRPGRSTKAITREVARLAPREDNTTSRRVAVIGQVGARPHGGLGFRKNLGSFPIPFSVNRLIALSANSSEVGRGGRKAGRSGGKGPNDRYLRLARRHAVYGVMAGILAVLLAAWSFTAALSEAPGWSIAAGCSCVLAVFITTLETSESLRCLRIAARWVRWDRELNNAS